MASFKVGDYVHVEDKSQSIDGFGTIKAHASQGCLKVTLQQGNRVVTVKSERCSPATRRSISSDRFARGAAVSELRSAKGRRRGN